MIRLMGVDGRDMLVAASAIAQVMPAGASQGWHGVQANVKTFDGKWIEVRDSVDEVEKKIMEAMGAKL